MVGAVSSMDAIDPQVRQIVAAWPQWLRELWAERAAIREHDGGMPREAAEAAAVMDVIGRLKRDE